MNETLLIVSCLMLGVMITYLQRQSKHLERAGKVHRDAVAKAVEEDANRTEAYQKFLNRLVRIEEEKCAEFTKLRQLEQYRLEKLAALEMKTQR